MARIMQEINRLNVCGHRVKCIMDWGHFQAGSVYYVQSAVDVHKCGIVETVCDVFFGPEPYGGGRCVLLSDLKDFFRLEE